MSRPKPTIELSYTNPKTYILEQVLKSDAVYAVFFDGHPINLRSTHMLKNSPGPKYPRSSFGNSAHAFNLAEKLNKLFKTNKFEVYRLTVGEKITESQDK